MNKAQMFTDLITQMEKTYIAKNHDYGNSFSKLFNEYGILASVIRLSDKLERVKTLTKQEALVDEKIEDTLLDMANYAVMTVIEMRSNNGVQLQEKNNN